MTTVENAKSNAAAVNTLILRNYNDGRQGGWNNYCCYKGQQQGSYVNNKKTTQVAKSGTNFNQDESQKPAAAAAAK